MVLAILRGLGGVDAGLLAALGGAAFGFQLGTGTVMSHIAADELTPAGVKPFWPLRDDKFRYVVVRAANPLANYTLLGIGGGTALLALVIGSVIV